MLTAEEKIVALSELMSHPYNIDYKTAVLVMALSDDIERNREKAKQGVDVLEVNSDRSFWDDQESALVSETIN